MYVGEHYKLKTIYDNEQHKIIINTAELYPLAGFITELHMLLLASFTECITFRLSQEHQIKLDLFGRREGSVVSAPVGHTTLLMYVMRFIENQPDRGK